MTKRAEKQRRKRRTKSGDFFARHRILTSFVVTAVMLLLIGVMAEIALRIAGYTPHSRHYTLVSELEVYDQFYTDETGILKMRPAFFAEHKGVSINSDGFRDREIQDELRTGRPTIMFVGDSFTFGLSAEPITNCFADLVENFGCTALNFGVAATGPVQYAAVVEHYLPVVKPDMLAVMLYLGNDVNQFPQRVVPYKPNHHGTNAGAIYAFDANGNYMTAEEAYDYYFGGFFQKVEYHSRKSVLACILGRSMIQLRDATLMKRHRESSGGGEDRNQYVIDSLASIKQVADEFGVRCCCFVIPVRPSNRHKLNRFDEVRYILDGHDYVYVDFEEELYCTGRDAHFNNAGHRRMAEIIREVFEDPESPLIGRN